MANPTVLLRDVASVIRERHSSRVAFDSARPVPEEDIRRILEAARWAPTPHNMQNFEIVVVDDKPLLERLGKIQFRVSAEFMRENYQQLSFSVEELKNKKVGVLAAMFPPSWTDPASFDDVHGDGEPRMLLDMINGSQSLILVTYDARKRAPASAGDVLGILGLGCVMENMWLTAESLGIGLQIISSFSAVEEEIKQVLDIPEPMRLAYGLRLGYPIAPTTPVRVRRDLKDLVHSNRYGRHLARRPV